MPMLHVHVQLANMPGPTPTPACCAIYSHIAYTYSQKNKLLLLWLFTIHYCPKCALGTWLWPVPVEVVLDAGAVLNIHSGGGGGDL